MLRRFVYPLIFELQVLSKSLPALATTAVLFTVTVTLSVLLQPLDELVLVTVYSVVTLGLAVGLLMPASLNPVAGDQE
jgi:hypothetical protein